MYVILAIIGACIGSFINLCIYNLGYKKVAISPWSHPANGGTRTFLQRVPVAGWFFRNDESTQFGRRFWLRPLAIELLWTIGLPLFYYWHLLAGLTGGLAVPATWTNIWFVGHSILFAFLFVATFIDFDQRIIPDSITVPGTIVALLIAAAAPSFRLPKIVAGLAGPSVESLHFADSAALPTWHFPPTGLAIALTVILIWIVALLPKLPLVNLDFKSIRLVFASTCRFLRPNRLKVRNHSRKTGLTILATGAFVLVAVSIAWWQLPALHWTSLFGAIAGLGFGGMSVWSVRIVASHSLGQEAMGFGDVTLMAMIGTFVGWQAALIVFTLSPFAALAIVAVNSLITKENELAFGPYLCLGAAVSIFGWSKIWPIAQIRFFINPRILLGVLAMSLVLLMVMMIGVRKFKESDYDEMDEEERDE